MKTSHFFNRDLSWLSFNERILQEAGRDSVPLMERIKFLSIFSSNLDEFYRVRMPVLMALQQLDTDEEIIGSHGKDVAATAREIIQNQQRSFGNILTGKLIPLLKENGYQLIYGKPIPESIMPSATNCFLQEVLTFIQIVDLSVEPASFFPENNKLYHVVTINENGLDKILVINIPSDCLPRFFSFSATTGLFILFLDDIIRHHLQWVFPSSRVTGCYSFKITRDAEINLKDDYPGDVADALAEQLAKRDFGKATRFLYQPDMPLDTFYLLLKKLDLSPGSVAEGGIYHNLKDLQQLPVKNKELEYEPWPAALSSDISIQQTIFDQITDADRVVHTPYQQYKNVIRFFNEAVVDPLIDEIYVTLYRVASDSRIVRSLISAAKNGKKVTVLIELKARFDEENNIKWAKTMKQAGVQIVYSRNSLKVHAKIALVKRNENNGKAYYGLLATGNFNETTAAFYTDHVLMTAHREMLLEMEQLFIFLSKREKTIPADFAPFKHLLVAQFNLHQHFLDLIDREIVNAYKGLPAEIFIKLNNLEERSLIAKLYEASLAGVKITLIVRSICCLIPGVEGLSENITVIRIVDRYLEHGRVFIFHNAGNTEVYAGSADWMNRNIYRRVEVCFPIYDERIKNEFIDILKLQTVDNVQAVQLNRELGNMPLQSTGKPVRSQYEIYRFLKNKSIPAEPARIKNITASD
ncbi:polyphosphate kinase 1 [Pedobacter sp. HMF7647]|uniref:Polyphosphate kinase n=1 Tax=Hufsiella arboris TaxID=2695275 RepID=A0A7K1Y7R5_9SPHI|nr:polyphosphate kinase 1 [Hufsiella arboris]MXV50625.1 polyphosphate kinase 1 [Hufsiella arboris]